MDASFESKMINKFFSSCSAERLIHEAVKKRDRIFDKLSHTCEKYLKQDVISDKSKMPQDKSKITKFLSDKKCYVMALNSDLDGEYADITDALNALYRNGSPYVLVSADCNRVYLETEYNFSEHYSYFLAVKITPLKILKTSFLSHENIV